MPRLHIPKGLYPNFQVLVHISKSLGDKIIAVLPDLKYTIKVEDLAEHLANHIDEISPQEAGQIAIVILSLYNLMGMDEYSANEVSRDIAISAEQSKELIKPDGWSHDEFSSFLLQVLTVGGSLAILAKGNGVVNDHQHLFYDSRILTDLRPIFKPSAEQVPDALVIVHHLKIAYVDGKDQKEFFVAMDESDLHKLQKNLEKAIAKANNLKPIIEKSGLHYIKTRAEGE